MTDALPACRPGEAASPELIARRAAGEAIGGQPIAAGIDASMTMIAGLACGICKPSQPVGRLIWMHGGAFRLGSARAWLPFGSRIAAATGLEVIIPDYRLAPENPFPAALEDCRTVMRQLHQNGKLLFIGGDSAGGNLALGAVLSGMDEHLLADGIILISPWLDLTLTAETYRSRAASDQLFSAAAAADAVDFYLRGFSPLHRLVSPLKADFAGLPPAFIVASGSEVLLQDSLTFAQSAARAAGDVTLRVYPGEAHVWPVIAAERPASIDAIAAIAGFVRRIAPENID